jgi:hypothetical protein
MKTPRDFGFWIDSAAVVVSVGLCLASIFATGRTAIYLLGFGALLFIPAAARLASRPTGAPVFHALKAAPRETGRQRIWSAIIGLFSCLLGMGELASPHPLWQLNSPIGAAWTLILIALAGWNGLELIAGVRDLRARPSAR